MAVLRSTEYTEDYMAQEQIAPKLTDSDFDSFIFCVHGPEQIGSPYPDDGVLLAVNIFQGLNMEKIYNT